MASRPRRTAMTRANEAIANVCKNSERDQASSTKLLRPSSSRINTRGASRASSESNSSQHLDTSSYSRMPASKLRHVTGAGGGQATVGRRDQFFGGEIIDGKRNRGGKKTYVVESDSDDGDGDGDDDEMADDDNDEMGEDDDDDDDDEEMADAEGEEDAEEDAEGEEEDDLDEVDFISTPQPAPAPPAIKISKAKATPPPAKSRSAARPSARAILDDDDDEDEDDDEDDDDDDDDDNEDDDDDDLSDPESVLGNETHGDQTLVEDEDDAEGEEDEEEDGDEDPSPDMMALAEDDAEGEEDEDAEGEPGEPDSEDDMSRTGTPDLSKMTRRQRARFEDAPQQHMKLSDEVQVKKHFTAEELSMRRAEMARRRRNLSEKRNEEVKMETINKLLKRQAPKTKGKANAGVEGGEDGDGDGGRPNPTFVRWVNTRAGSRIAVPAELVSGPAGSVFGGPLGGGRKLIEEVS